MKRFLKIVVAAAMLAIAVLASFAGAEKAPTDGVF